MEAWEKQSGNCDEKKVEKEKGDAYWDRIRKVYEKQKQWRRKGNIDWKMMMKKKKKELGGMKRRKDEKKRQRRKEKWVSAEKEEKNGEKEGEEDDEGKE